MTQEQLPTIDETTELKEELKPFRLECKTPYGETYLEVPHGMPIGALHDAIIQYKTFVISRMTALHNQEVSLPQGESDD